MICHNQGAVHVRNALLDYPPEPRARILVVAIAPPGYVYAETCADVIHSISRLYCDHVEDRHNTVDRDDTFAYKSEFEES